MVSGNGAARVALAAVGNRGLTTGVAAAEPHCIDGSRPRLATTTEFQREQREIEMGFGIQNLSVLAYANGFTLWHYKAAAGGLAAAAAPAFFHAASDLLAGGDLVMVSSADGGRMLCVAAGEDGVVTAPMG